MRKELLIHSDKIVELFNSEGFRNDREESHRTADKILCEIIGLYLPEYNGAVEAFKNHPKWYA